MRGGSGEGVEHGRPRTAALALGVEIGALQKLREFDLEDPAVKAKLRERCGKNIPLDEPVISPAAMFASPELATILQQ